MSIASPEAIESFRRAIGKTANPALVESLQSLLRKSQQDIPEPPVLPTAILINFDGAGQPLTVGMSGLAEITFPCRILGCHLFAGVWNATTRFQPVAVTATVDLGLGSQGAWAGGTISLVGTTLPALSATAEADVSIAGWTIVELQPGDLIPYALASFTGTATFLSVAIPVRRLDVRGIGVSSLTDGGGDDFTDGSGSSFTIRG